MSTQKYKLIYFHLKGRGEVTRTLFRLAGQPFEDHRIPLDDSWPPLKPQFPFHQLPVLEVTDASKTYRIAQSHAMERFLANRFGLFGRDDRERAQIDMIGEQIVDVFNTILPIYRKPDSAEKKRELEEALRDRVPAGLKMIEDLVKEEKSGFLVGNQISLVDVQIINFYDWLRDRKGEILAQLPLLKKHDEFIRSQPKIAEQLKSSAGVRLARLFPD